MAKSSSGGKNKKYGRNEAWCKGYASAGTELRNRKRRMLRHMRNNPGCNETRTRYEALFGKVPGLELAGKGRRVARRALVRVGMAIAKAGA